MTGDDRDRRGDPFCVDHGARIWIGGNDRDARRFVEQELQGKDTARPPEGSIHVAFITPQTADEAMHFFAKLSPRLLRDASVHLIFKAPGLKGRSDPSPLSPEELAARLESQGWSASRWGVGEGEFHCVSTLRADKEGVPSQSELRPADDANG